MLVVLSTPIVGNNVFVTSAFLLAVTSVSVVKLSCPGLLIVPDDWGNFESGRGTIPLP